MANLCNFWPNKGVSFLLKDSYLFDLAEACERRPDEFVWNSKHNNRRQWTLVHSARPMVGLVQVGSCSPRKLNYQKKRFVLNIFRHYSPATRTDEKKRKSTSRSCVRSLWILMLLDSFDVLLVGQTELLHYSSTAYIVHVFYQIHVRRSIRHQNQ